MVEFYCLPRSLRILASTASILAVALFLVAALVCAVRRRRVFRQLSFSETLLLIIMALNALSLVDLIARVQLGIGDDFLYRSGAPAIRCWLLAVTAAAGVIVSARQKRLEPMVFLLPELLTLPVSEQLSGIAFPLLFFFAVFLDIALGSVVIASSKRSMSADMSAASVKQAIDALHTGGHVLRA